MIIIDPIEPMPKSHRGEPRSRHEEAFMPSPQGARRKRNVAELHFGHRPGSLATCPGMHCMRYHKPNREVQA